MLAFHVETLENFKDDLQDIQSSLSVYSSDLTHLDAFAAGVGYARLNFKAEIFLKLLSEVNKTKIEDKDKLDIIQNVMIGKIGIIKPMLKAVKRESIVFPKRRVPVECLQKSKKDVKSWVEKIQDLEKSEMLAKKLHDELNQSPSVKCELCGLEIPESQYQLLDNCSHMFHSSCFTLNLQNQILARKTPMMCPGKGCVKEVGMTDLRHYLDKP